MITKIDYKESLEYVTLYFNHIIGNIQDIPKNMVEKGEQPTNNYHTSKEFASMIKLNIVNKKNEHVIICGNITIDITKKDIS